MVNEEYSHPAQIYGRKTSLVKHAHRREDLLWRSSRSFSQRSPDLVLSYIQLATYINDGKKLTFAGHRSPSLLGMRSEVK